MSFALPPVSDGLDGEARRIKAVSNADITVIVIEAVNAVGHCLPDRILRKIVHQHRLGLEAPGSRGVLEVVDQLFFLVYTLITGSPLARKSFFCSSMC